MAGNATVIFDFDGTLANSVDLMFRLYNDHALQFGYLPMAREEFPALRRMGYSKAMRMKKVKVRMLPKIILTLGKEMRASMDEVKPYDGIVKTLHSLQNHGFSIGILTSNQAGLVDEFLKAHKFPEFDFVVSEKTLFGKDKALKRIFKRFGLDRDQVVYVGDEPRDIVASRKARIRSIAVTWGLGGHEAFEKTKPDILVSTPDELLNKIITLSQE
jgi:HAD superfamily hydrolase (TIGR01549 family)